jgi:GH18 family chitinase
MQLFAAVAFALLLSLAGFAAEPEVEAKPEFRILGYLPDYRCEIFNPRQAALVTDLIYMAAEPKETGELDLRRVKPEHLALLAKLRKEQGARVHFALGGWGRCSGFPAVAQAAERRKAFTKNVCDYCRAHEFAGVDLDWEFPKDEAEQADFAELLAELQAGLKEDGRELSIAIAPWQRLPQGAWAHVDRVHLMSYDHAGRHATYAQAEKDMERVLALGIPREKLLLGLPCYARHTSDKERTLTWLEIVGRYDPPATSDEVAGFYYNGPATIANKTKLAQSRRLSGVFFWELGQDTDGARSLVRAAVKARQPADP